MGRRTAQGVRRHQAILGLTPSPGSPSNGHYLLSAECIVVCKDDVVKYMLSLPILKGRVGKWILAFSEFDLRYESAKAVKGQVMADFVARHCGQEIAIVELAPWTLYFDGSSCGAGPGQESASSSYHLWGQVMISRCRLRRLPLIIKQSIGLF